MTHGYALTVNDIPTVCINKVSMIINECYRALYRCVQDVDLPWVHTVNIVQMLTLQHVTREITTVYTHKTSWYCNSVGFSPNHVNWCTYHFAHALPLIVSVPSIIENDNTQLYTRITVYISLYDDVYVTISA